MELTFLLKSEPRQHPAQMLLLAPTVTLRKFKLPLYSSCSLLTQIYQSKVCFPSLILLPLN